MKEVTVEALQWWSQEVSVSYVNPLSQLKIHVSVCGHNDVAVYAGEQSD
jgi:hypothetical protein